MREVQLFKDIFSKLGVTTSASLAELAEQKRDCLLREDPNSFYATTNLSPEQNMEWFHNMKRHLGVDALDYQAFLSHIHPAWFPLHRGYTIGAYETLYSEDFGFSHRNCIYTINVPLSHPDGSYHWYNQMTVAAGFDEKEAMTMHLSHYHRLCEYDRLVPQRPVFMVNGVLNNQYSDRLQKQVEPVTIQGVLDANNINLIRRKHYLKLVD
jgi:hypothetical protein